MLLLGGAVVVVLGVSLFLFMRSADESGNAGHEFPDDWFAMALGDEKIAQLKLIGKPMPPLDVVEWHNGELKPDDLKGKVLLLDFWGTFCAPCLAAFPANNELYAKYKSKGVEFIGICTNEGQENYDKVIALKKPEYPTARDAEFKTMKAWSAQTYPLYVAVDRKGIVRAMGIKHEYIEKVIEKLAAEKAE